MYNTLIRLQLIQEDECGEEHEVEGAPDVMYINKHLCTIHTYYIVQCIEHHHLNFIHDHT